MREEIIEKIDFTSLESMKKEQAIYYKIYCA